MTLDPKTAAAICGVSQVALFHWRKDGTGPQWAQTAGRRIQYDAKSVYAFEFARRAKPLIDRIAALEARLATLEAGRVSE